MSIINRITKNLGLRKNNENDLTIFNRTFSQLSHDLKNNFIAIRASAGNIKNSFRNENIKPENIDKALLGIDKKINHSITILNMMTILTSPINNRPNDISKHSITECIQQTIQCYPFTSEKYASFINIATPTVDFSVMGNIDLIKAVFYCLINNAVRAIYNSGSGEAFIYLDKNKVQFKFTDNSETDDIKKQNLFTLGQPEKPGNGLIFITNVIMSMNGKVDFKKELDSESTITIHFAT